jgi:hypothetical protein
LVLPLEVLPWPLPVFPVVPALSVGTVLRLVSPPVVDFPWPPELCCEDPRLPPALVREELVLVDVEVLLVVDVVVVVVVVVVVLVVVGVQDAWTFLTGPGGAGERSEGGGGGGGECRAGR